MGKAGRLLMKTRRSKGTGFDSTVATNCPTPIILTVLQTPCFYHAPVIMTNINITIYVFILIPTKPQLTINLESILRTIQGK